MPTAVIGDEKYLIDSYIRSGKLLHLHSRVQLHLKERPPASHQGCREGEEAAGRELRVRGRVQGHDDRLQ